MSKAFTREDDAQPERRTRMRPASGLPPGTLNFLTADGARLLRIQLAEFSEAEGERADGIRRILATATIVEPPSEPPSCAVFGAAVELCDADGARRKFRIVGADETDLHPHGVSWISATGRSLLGAEPGQRVTLEADGESRKFTVVRIEH